MPTWEVIAIIAIVVAVVLGVVLLMSRRRTDHLRSRFGPEYQRTVQERGLRRAEEELERRERRVEKLHIHPLSPKHRDEFVAAWRRDQARFVDDPSGAVSEADRLVQEVMKHRGYPVSDFDRRVEDISVDHPHLVDNYRAARVIAERNRRGSADTEELRKALVYYRALFEELLEGQEVLR